MATQKYTDNADVFKKGECVCPHCNYDHVGFEHGADFMELPGIDQAYCTECEGEFIIKLEYKITSLKMK